MESTFGVGSLSSLRSRGINAFAWDFLGTLSIRLVTFGVILILARLLEPADFGLIALIMVIEAVALVFIDGGLGMALIQRRHLHAAHYSTAFYFNVLMGVGLGGVVFVSANAIADFYGQPRLEDLLQVASILLVLNALGATQRTILRKQLNNKRLSKINITAALLAGSIGIFLAFAGFGVWALLIQILASSTISLILLWAYSDWHPEPILSWRALRGLWSFGLRMFLVRLLDNVYTRTDYIVIGKLFPIDILGFFQRAKSLSSIAVYYSSGSLISVLFPVLSKIQKDLKRFQDVVLKGFKIVLFMSFLVFGGLYVTAEPLIVILYSEKWRPSAEYFAILALSGVSYPLNAVLVNVLSSRGNSKSFLRMEVIKKAIGILNLLIGFSFGLLTYLYGLIVVAIVNTAINIQFAAKEGEFQKLQLIGLIATQIAITAIAIFGSISINSYVQLSDIYSLLSSGAIFSFIYFGLNFIFSTSTYIEFRAEAQPMLVKLKNKISRMVK